MSRKTQAEIFIQTLEEMLDQDRECQKARLRLEVKAHVKRFMSEFRTLPEGDRHPAPWTSQNRHAAQETTQQAPLE